MMKGTKDLFARAKQGLDGLSKEDFSSESVIYKEEVQGGKGRQREYKVCMESYIKSKNEFDSVAHSIVEKQKLYIDLARKNVPKMDNKKEKNQASIGEINSARY